MQIKKEKKSAEAPPFTGGNQNHFHYDAHLNSLKKKIEIAFI